MIRYLDSGRPGTVCPGRWYDTELVPDIRSFRGQFGYFRAAAIVQHVPTLRAIAAAGGVVRLVLGSNRSDPLSAADLRSLLPVGWNGQNACLTVVALRGALFHPKAAHVVRSNGEAIGLVGSANLTPRGLGRNVEGWVEMADGDGGCTVALTDLAAAIDWWHGCGEVGVYSVTSEAEVAQLLAAEIIVAVSERASDRGTGGGANGRGRRSPRWRPRGLPPAPSIASTGTRQRPPAPASVTPPAQPAATWWKQLPSSDAQQVGPGTSPTGKLRLTQSGHPINAQTWFRHDFFGPDGWGIHHRGGRTYEVKAVTFEVTVNGVQWGLRTLMIDHAPHREADQANITTVLAWGTELNRWLRVNDSRGQWVVIERLETGEYHLRIQRDPPA